MDEVDLVVRCQAGELDAFEGLFRLHSRRVLQTAYLITGDRQVAEEVLQDAFAQTFLVIRRLREPLAFASWLTTITVRQARKHLRQEWAERHIPQKCADEPADTPPSPYEQVENREVLWSALCRLPENQRVATVLHYYRDLPLAEIAEIMEVPVGTVKSWLHRARAALVDDLRQEITVPGGESGHG